MEVGIETDLERKERSWTEMLEAEGGFEEMMELTV